MCGVAVYVSLYCNVYMYVHVLCVWIIFTIVIINCLIAICNEFKIDNVNIYNRKGRSSFTEIHVQCYMVHDW